MELSLCYGDFYDAFLLFGKENPDRSRSGTQVFIVLDSFPKWSDVRIRKLFVYFYEIFFRNMFLRREQLMRKEPVIHKEKESLAVLIESSDRKEVFPVRFRNQVQHGFLFSVFGGGEHTDRFMHHVIGKCLIFYAFSLVEDMVAFFYGKVCIANDAAVYFHKLFSYLLLDIGTACQPHIRQVFVQTHFFSTFFFLMSFVRFPMSFVVF